MRNQLTIILTIISISVLAQSKRKIISGVVYFDNSKIADVHVKNRSTNQGTNSNNKGSFEIPIQLGDTLLFSHVKLFEEKIIISEKNIKENSLKVILREKIYTLEEITIGKQRSILFLDDLILPPPVVNAQTLNLPFANSKIIHKDQIFKFSSGGVISLDNLINTLNGNKIREKELLKIKQEDNYIAKIRKYFSDDFFVTDLKITTDKINTFLNFCVKRNIIRLYVRDEKIKLTQIFLTESKNFIKNEFSEYSLAKE